MKTIHMLKALASERNGEVIEAEATTLVFDQELVPEIQPDTLRSLFDGQAERLAKALAETLPKGVFERLVSVMAEMAITDHKTSRGVM